MHALLICPDQRDSAALMRRMRPLALMPVLGRTLLDLWLEHLASTGLTSVTVLVADRPDDVRRAVHAGDRYGLQVSILAVSQEPSAGEAVTRFSKGDTDLQVFSMNTLPGAPDAALWSDSGCLFSLLIRQLENESGTSRISMREIAPGVHASSRARIATTAVIDGPAWIGPGVIISDHAHITAGSIIESASYIDHHATVSASWIGPETYVGALTEINRSCAWGTCLESRDMGSMIEITDAFLLSSLKKQSSHALPCGWMERLLALLLFLITSPLALLSAFWTRCFLRLPAFSARQVLLPDAQRGYAMEASELFSLNQVQGLLSRWPELWAACRGRLHLVGNRPLSSTELEELDGEFEKLWLSAPVGVFSLADAVNDGLQDHSSALSHSACYAVSCSRRLNTGIFLRCLVKFLLLRLSLSPASKTDLNPHQQPQPC